MPSVLQDWVENLSFMQQSVLITACRGPDGLPKNHPAKRILRWLRRSFLKSAFDRGVIHNPGYEGGGSFTGPSCYPKWGIPPECPTPVARKDREAMCLESCPTMKTAVDGYLSSVDEVPHHFHLHLMHAAEILGYKHFLSPIRNFWHEMYLRMVKDAHLNPETEEQMNRRLGDNETAWRQAEEVVAR